MLGVDRPGQGARHGRRRRDPPQPRPIDLQRVFWRELRHPRRTGVRAHRLRARGRTPRRRRHPRRRADQQHRAASPRPRTRSPTWRAGRAMKVLVDLGAGRRPDMTITLFDLTGKTAVVTGAKRGIGFAIAEALAARGRRHHRRQRHARNPPAAPSSAASRPRPRLRPAIASTSPTARRRSPRRRAGRSAASTSWSTTPARSSGRRPPSIRWTCGTASSRSISPASSC